MLRPSFNLIAAALLSLALLALPARGSAQGSAADSAFAAAQRASADDAEQAWLRFIVEFPVHARTGEALYELARLELARGDGERAAAHLERAVREFPSSPRRAAAALALARLRLDQRDAAAGCAAIVEARAAVGADDLELRNQIEYQERRCASERAATAARDTTMSPASERSRTPSNSAASSKRGGTPAPERRAPTAGSRSQGRYTIQIAAFNTRGEAESLVDALRGRELEARVVGTRKPFRVRVGRYATRKDATAALARLKSRKVTSSGFVTEAETGVR